MPPLGTEELEDFVVAKYYCLHLLLMATGASGSGRRHYKVLFSGVSYIVSLPFSGVEPLGIISAAIVHAKCPRLSPSQRGGLTSGANRVTVLALQC